MGEGRAMDGKTTAKRVGGERQVDGKEWRLGCCIHLRQCYEIHEHTLRAMAAARSQTLPRGREGAGTYRRAGGAEPPLPAHHTRPPYASLQVAHP